VADDFFAAGCVLGSPVARSSAPNLLEVAGRAVINGVEVARGTGADVLGHPHNALAWLANHLAASGQGLRAGQIVLTGSLVKTVWLNAGDEVTMELEGLGRVGRQVHLSGVAGSAALPAVVRSIEIVVTGLDPVIHRLRKSCYED